MKDKHQNTIVQRLPIASLSPSLCTIPLIASGATKSIPGRSGL